jgi:hypothetical protein
MGASEFLFDIETQAGPLRIARITTATANEIRAIDRFSERDYTCEVLIRGDSDRLVLKPGDEVLMCELRAPESRFIVMGRLSNAAVDGQSQAESAARDPAPTVPDTLLVEARECLTLRVGEGSITIRADGKILIKGRDLVSHAKNVNRVKGGAVAIN